MSPAAHSTLQVQRDAQRAWASRSIAARLTIVRRLRHLIAQRAGEFARTVSRDQAQTLTAEVLPLLEACRFLEENAEQILAAAPPIGRLPQWLRGVSTTVHREPLGVILVVGPANYPLFLPAAHAVQAVVAGNSVLIKPGVNSSEPVDAFAQAFAEAGLPDGVCTVLDEEVDCVAEAIKAGVAKVVLTGSSSTGRAVMAQLARTGTPSVMELSGHDVVFVRPGADAELVRKAVQFGLRLNDGQTCIAPKLVIAWPGAPEDVFGLPVHRVESDEEALAIASRSGYALGATVFGKTADCVEFAKKVQAGVVVVNDMIVPTADPRLPFGGRAASGFGVTRGTEGLLEMTAVKAVAVRTSRWLPHLDPPNAADAELFRSYIGWLHGDTLRSRFGALAAMIRAARERRRRPA